MDIPRGLRYKSFVTGEWHNRADMDTPNVQFPRAVMARLFSRSQGLGQSSNQSYSKDILDGLYEYCSRQHTG